MNTIIQYILCILLIFSEVLIRFAFRTLGLDEQLGIATSEGSYFFGKFLSICGVIWGISIKIAKHNKNGRQK